MHRQTKVWYAIKSIRKSIVKIEVLKRELEILMEVNHPNIIRLIEVHKDEKYIHLIMELCTGGALFDRIVTRTTEDRGPFLEQDAVKLVRDILSAIAYCHDVNHIVHRDLKPFYIFLRQRILPSKL
jgi:calcium-dependent protein kinase